MNTLVLVVLKFLILEAESRWLYRSEPSNYLLPTTTIPSHYNLKLITKIDQFNESDSSSFKFEGIIEVIFQVLERNVTSVVLNGDRITIHKSILRKYPKGRPIKLVNPTPTVDQYQKLTFQLQNSKLKSNRDYALKIYYEGWNRRDLEGFYRSGYEVENGKTRWLLTTQFESCLARRAFPCFDEPKYRATYSIEVSLSKSLTNYSVLTNTMQDGPPITDPHNHKNFLYRFKKTPVTIPSYLVAFVISDFRSTSGQNFTSDYENQVGPKIFRTWGQEKYIDRKEGVLSQTLGPQCLDYLTKKFKIGYALEKIDQVGIPDFAAGAMENWGLITYKERYLLANTKEDSIDHLLDVCTTIIHELVHQWFGNLVTLHSWNDIWLNEAFPDYFQYYILSKLHNDELNIADWDLPALFLVNEVQAAALDYDVAPDISALTSEEYDPDLIDGHFDSISYSKGGAVLRMFRHILGSKIFFQGLRNYLHSRQQSIGTPLDLMDGFQKAVAYTKDKPNLGGRTVAEIFENWRILPGYPVVQVHRRKRNELFLTQERFFMTRNSSSRSKWYVPISYTTNKELMFTARQRHWLTPQNNLTIRIDSDVDWYVVNNQQTGYFRVNYDEENWKSLIKVLKNESTFQLIHSQTRAQLIDDSFNLAMSSSRKYLNASIPLELVSYIKDVKEKSTAPTLACSNHVNSLVQKLANNPAINEKFRMYAIKIFKDSYKSMKFVQRQMITSSRIQQNSIVSLACTLGIEDCVESSNTMFGKFFASNQSSAYKINPDIRRTVYCTAVRSGPKENWFKLWERYVLLEETLEKDDIVSALGCTRNEYLAKQLLKKTLREKSGLAKQDRISAFKSVYKGNPKSVFLARDFLIKHFDTIVKRYKQAPLSKLLVDLSKVLQTKEDLKLMLNIKKSQELRRDRPGMKISEDILSTIRQNIMWTKNIQPELHTWLENNEI